MTYLLVTIFFVSGLNNLYALNTSLTPRKTHFLPYHWEFSFSDLGYAHNLYNRNSEVIYIRFAPTPCLLGGHILNRKSRESVPDMNALVYCLNPKAFWNFSWMNQLQDIFCSLGLSLRELRTMLFANNTFFTHLRRSGNMREALHHIFLLECL